MAEQKSIAALQPHLALAKGQGPAACADIIMRATDAPGCYVFGELLDLPSIAALESHPEYAKYHKLLRIFAYGTYTDYLAHADSLPPLSPTQTTKLKQLTLVTLATHARTTPLTYTNLQSTLAIPTVRLLEDLVISTIYASLLTGKLDTLRQRVEVTSTFGRDIAPGDVDAMLETMENWGAQCEAVLGDIEAEIQRVFESAEKVKKEEAEYNKMVERKRDGSGGSIQSMLRGKRGGEEGGDEMEVDEELGRGGRRKRGGVVKKR
ncbi:hypothetical protein BJ508DRAFT_216938 [Ascobolus immersus RN42]|uniref:PCI domain-containing protein n=1 Tax=Ascobolus immersus RN42 TaxID=1160509 RepID=A0A3N4HKZ7_ASCIM|nr:hypothetical protein BJ508DRAFT_216938 [Ascobolus immersus RN42]